ncbi:MAG: hypothetical protein GY774_16660 [Planctomycetes bacterium]|nr:hypothetical protein [Planctomycetota bacterium]
MIIRENLKQKLAKPQDVAAFLKGILRKEHIVDRDKEHFWVIGRKTNGSIRYVELVSLGSLREATVEPRETYRLAIRKSVESIICVHNHPSGDPEPSGPDKKITERLKEAGKIIGITLLDHVIVGDREYYSFQQNGRGRF